MHNVIPSFIIDGIMTLVDRKVEGLSNYQLHVYSNIFTYHQWHCDLGN